MLNHNSPISHLCLKQFSYLRETSSSRCFVVIIAVALARIYIRPASIITKCLLVYLNNSRRVPHALHQHRLSASIIAIDERHKPDTSTTTNFPAFAFVASFTSPLRLRFFYESRRAYATEARNVLFFSSQFSAGCLSAKSRNVRARLVNLFLDFRCSK